MVDLQLRDWRRQLNLLQDHLGWQVVDLESLVDRGAERPVQASAIAELYGSDGSRMLAELMVAAQRGDCGLLITVREKLDHVPNFDFAVLACCKDQITLMGRVIPC